MTTIEEYGRTNSESSKRKKNVKEFRIPYL